MNIQRWIFNDGYSTMCAHATIALGRLLLDTHDLNVFPRRNDIVWDQSALIAYVNIHAPCGLLRAKVPVNANGSASDPILPVSFVSVPFFASGLQIPVNISHRWPQLKGSKKADLSVTVDFAYGGAFYAFVDVKSLGFEANLQDINIKDLSTATDCLILSIREQSGLAEHYRHPDEPDLSFLYGVIVTDDVLRDDKPVAKAELGVCFFADQEIDRSPTGSGVAARVALAYHKGERDPGVSWAYHHSCPTVDRVPLSWEQLSWMTLINQVRGK